MEEPKDKRTKAWKQWNKEYGLGDLVEDIAKATGIKDAVGDCKPCDERKKKLNELITLRKAKVRRCLTDEQTQQFKQYKENKQKNKWNNQEISLLINLYSHVFAIKYNKKDLCTNCAGSAKILQKIDKRLTAVYNEINR